MCQVTLTDEWRAFFKSIKPSQFKILESCIVLREDDFKQISALAGVPLYPGVDSCMAEPLTNAKH